MGSTTAYLSETEERVVPMKPDEQELASLVVHSMRSTFFLNSGETIKSADVYETAVAKFHAAERNDTS